MKHIGTLRFRDFGTGAWILESTDGTVYDLQRNQVPERKLNALRDQRVEVVASGGGFGFGMAGSESLLVQSIRALR
jgi:hypothetical protein